MSTPVYRLTAFQPRSVDPSETGVLTPIAGAAHADPFRIASKTGIAGAQPFLDTLRGRRGRIDPLSRTTDTGKLTVRCLDRRTGDDNATRWLTAFLGDEQGNARLIGLLVRIEESVDGGETWSDFFTGRVQDVRLASKLWFELVLRDMAEDLRRDVFVGRPLSVAYASFPPLLPRGVADSYGDFPVQPPLSGTVQIEPLSILPGVGAVRLTAASAARSLITRAVHDLTQDPGLPVGGAYLGITDRARVRLTRTDTGESGEFRLAQIAQAMWAPVGHNVGYFEYLSDSTVGGIDADAKDRGHWYLTRVGIMELPPADPDYLALPSAGTSVSIEILPNVPASEDAPLFIGDVHPVQLWRDLLDGRFSRPGPGGGPVQVLDYDEDAFAALIADPSIPTARFKVEKSATLNEWVERHICQPYNLAYRLDALGRVVPIDMRLPAAVPTATTITRTDVEVGAAPEWSHARDTALTRIEITHYAERTLEEKEVWSDSAEFPDIPAAAIAEQDVLYIHADLAGVPDYGEHTLKIDALGYRHTPTETTGDGQNKGEWVRRKLDELVGEIRGPFGGGSMIARLRCRRTATTTGCQPGDWRLVDIDALPNPGSNVRGGVRLMRCIERTEDGPAILLTFLDAGPGSVATAPALGALALDTTGDRPAVTVPVTLNAAGEPVRVEFASTGSDVSVAPDGASGLWTLGAIVTASGTARIALLPDAARIWVRARTQATEAEAAHLPSGWVYPTGPGYVDTASTPRIYAAAVEIDAAGVATASWTVSGSTKGMRLRFAAHADPSSPPTTLPDVQDVDAGSGGAVITSLNVRPGETLTVDFESWTGWTGSAVSGTAGDRVRRTAVTSTTLSSYGLRDFREVESSAPGKRRFAWTSHGVRVESIWWAARAYAVPFDLADAWADLAERVEQLPEGQTWVEVDVPADDENVLLQVEPRLADLTVHDADVVERAQLYPVPSHLELSFTSDIVDNKVDLVVSLKSAPGSMPYPATVQVYEGDPLTGTLLTTIAATTDGRWTKAEVPALGGRALPAEGKRVWTAVATDRTGTTYVRESVVNAPRLPYFDAVRSVLSSDLLSVAIYGVVADPAGLGGTLEYWLPAATDQATNPSAAPTGSVVIPAGSMPYAIGPTAIPALGNVKTAGSSFTVVFKFTASDGRTTGRQPFPLAGSMQFLVDDLGKLRAESVHNGLVLASQFRPYHLGTGAPSGTPTTYGTDRYFDSAALTPYKWTGSAWAVDASTPAVAYAPILRAGVVTAEVIEATAVRAKLVGAERITADNITASLALEVGQEIRSTAYSPGVAGWRIKADGTVDFNGGTFRGVVRIDAATDFAAGYNPATKTTTFRQAGAPTATAVGDMWYDTADGNHPYRWSGSAWVSTRDSAAGSTTGLSASIYSASAPTTRPGGAALVQGDQWFQTTAGNKPHIWSGSSWVPAYTSIDGGSIKTGAIQSIVYTAGSAGWIINTDGTAEFNDVTIRGTLKAGTVMLDGGKALNLSRGLQSGMVEHNETITFERPFPTGTVPVVLLGGGGLTYDSTLPAGSQAQRFRALNVTETSFKASLVIASLAGTVTPREASFSGTTATKAEAAEAYDKTYTITYSVDVAGNFGASKSAVTIGFYANGVLMATRDYTNPEPSGGVPFSYPSQSLALVAAGMGASSTFTVQVISSTGSGGFVTRDKVRWGEATSPENSATPAGFKIPWIAVGGA